MRPIPLIFLSISLVLQGPFSGAQRTYTAHSVLATGNWYKLAVKNTGIYKIDIPFLNKIGLSGSSFPSASIRLFGNGGAMLPEANASPRPDDLLENAILVADGGDGNLNGTDYILFYARGPDQWFPDSAAHSFHHQRNGYTDQAFYYISIGGTGKRVATGTFSGGGATQVRSFDQYYFHELDTVNFLSSGKEWYGEEFANAPGKLLSRTFNVNLPNREISSPVTLRSRLVARSNGTSSRFDVSLNNQALSQTDIPAVGTGIYDLFAQEVPQSGSATVSSPELNITFNYTTGSFNSQGWLNWFEVFARGNLSMNGLGQLGFRDWNSVGSPSAEFIITNGSSQTQVWDITDPFGPVAMSLAIQGNELHFTNECSRLHEYLAFDAGGALLPEAVGIVANQDLHQSEIKDYLVVTHPSFLAQAQRLADFHAQKNNLRTIVVTTDQVYNEFSSGQPDPAAIRDFVKMYYDKAVTNGTDKPRYLLLLGDASYDYRDRLPENTNLLPAFESQSSLDPLSTYTSDDFFGFLDDNEDINSSLVINQLDIGVGRIPAFLPEDAKNFIDKVETYYSEESFGPWRNNETFIADDEDFNLHLQDAEIVTAAAATAAPVFNQQKIYLDAYQQESGAGGSRYPLANQVINNQVFNGTLIWNYNGHGGPRRLAEEVVIDQDIVNTWNNPNKLPLFITATCDFAPYDNPTIRSIGENILLRPKTGGIALLTTTRVVFAFSNRLMNANYMRFALQRDSSTGEYKTLGQSIREAKNYTYQTSGDVVNNRKFTLLGDPALALGFPRLDVRITKVNGIPIAGFTDTLRATDKVLFEGEVTDRQGNRLDDFNGTSYITVFDKPQTVNTLANDATSQVVGFSTQTNVLFKGKATVTGGLFSVTFKMPRDINYQFGKGKLSLYANDPTTDANGENTALTIGGIGAHADDDKDGPDIELFLNDDKFANGSVTNQNPVLIANLADSSGINTAGTGIGHDIVATLDDDNRKYYVLNDFYESELDSYQKGSIRFQLNDLEPGPHTLKLKAWDVLNNSGEKLIQFVVAKDEDLVLSHVLNYPNPFTTRTQFWFEHNKPGQELLVSIQIFTITGRVIKTLRQTINTSGNRSCEVEWDGRDMYGDKVARGVYLYRLKVTFPGAKKSKEVLEKLVIF